MLSTSPAPAARPPAGILEDVSTESDAPFRDETAEYARWYAPVSLLAAIAIGRALQIGNGAMHPNALFWITIALLLVIAATLVPRPVQLARFDEPSVRTLAVGGLAVQLGQLFTTMPALDLSLGEESLVPFYWGLAVLAALGASTILRVPRRAMPLQVGGLVVVHFALGVWLIRHSPHPPIDVHVFQHDAIAALRHGHDPYGLTFPNIYEHDGYYGSGLSVGKRLQFGFPYPPLSLLLAFPAQVLARDHRYAQLIALEAAAILMAAARPNLFGRIAAAVFLTTPRLFFVLQQAWTEPFVVLGVAAVAFAACRSRRAVGWWLGFFVALKQYLVAALPAALLLMPWPPNRAQIRRVFGQAAIVALAVTAPFLVWNPSGFWRSVVTLQLHQPFRPDALSYPAWWAARGHQPPSTLIAGLAMSAACAISLWRLPRTPGGFAAGVALTAFAFFAFNKQAFCNYYFFVVGALCVALAVWRVPTPPAERSTPTPGETDSLRRAFAS